MLAEDRTLRGRVGALALHAKYGRDTAVKGRAAFMGKFDAQARDEAATRGEILSEAELADRAEYLRKLHFTRMALASAKARRRNVAAT